MTLVIQQQNGEVFRKETGISITWKPQWLREHSAKRLATSLHQILRHKASHYWYNLMTLKYTCIPLQSKRIKKQNKNSRKKREKFHVYSYFFVLCAYIFITWINIHFLKYYSSPTHLKDFNGWYILSLILQTN